MSPSRDRGPSRGTMREADSPKCGGDRQAAGPYGAGMGIEACSRGRQHLLAVDRCSGGATQVCEGIVRALHEVAVFTGCAVMTTDPATLLPSGGVVEGFDQSACAPFWDNELLDPDFNKFVDLARSSDPVATLQDAVDGDLARSPRFVKLYAGYGLGDELRLAFTAGASCLAVGAFVRPSTEGPFTPQELADVRSLLPHAVAVLRRALGRVSEDQRRQAPVVITLDGEGGIVGMTEGAQDVLEEIRDSVTTGVPLSVEGLPQMVHNVALRARRSRTGSYLTTRIRGRSGRWLRVHVAPMQGQGASFVLTIEPAHPGDLARMLLDSYGLTSRETDIVLLLVRGMTAKEVAAELAISAHTVRDHVKAIYEKAGVNTRGELVAGLFANHVLAPLHAAVSTLGA